MDVRSQALGMAILTVVALVASTGAARVAHSEQPTGLPAWANSAPERFPWAITHVMTEDGYITELKEPVTQKRDVISAMVTAQEDAVARRASNERRDPDSSHDLLNALLVPVTCAYGSDWNLISTFVAEFGTVFFCSSPILKSALDRFGYIDPVFYELVQTDQNCVHFNAGALWIHTKYTSIDPGGLEWCSYGSGTVYFNTPQFWIDSGCHSY